MTVSRGVGGIIAAIAGILVVVIAVVILVAVLTPNSNPSGLISKTIDLRNAKTPIERANLITSIDDEVANLGAGDVKEQWDRMLSCLSEVCPDEAFLDLILVTTAAYETEISNSATIINAIATVKYWGQPEQMLDFSRAMSTANDQIDESDNRAAKKVWGQILACENTCAEKNDLYFALIRDLVQ
jgi:hypothetical protein